MLAGLFFITLFFRAVPLKFLQKHCNITEWKFGKITRTETQVSNAARSNFGHRGAVSDTVCTVPCSFLHISREIETEKGDVIPVRSGEKFGASQKV